MASLLVLTALVFGWVTIATHPMADQLERRRHPHRDDDLVRRACANLDDEYRQLLNH